MARASSDALDALHGLVAQTLTAELASAAERAQPKIVDGKPVPGDPISPQLIDKVLKFLKDNGIDSPAKSARVTALAAALDDLDLDQVGAERAH